MLPPLAAEIRELSEKFSEWIDKGIDRSPFVATGKELIDKGIDRSPSVATGKLSSGGAALARPPTSFFELVDMMKLGDFAGHRLPLLDFGKLSRSNVLCHRDVSFGNFRQHALRSAPIGLGCTR